FSVVTSAGGGNFAPATTYAVDANSGTIVLGDFNNDGSLDFATPLALENTVALRLHNAGRGRGGTTFTYDPKFNQVTSTTDEIGRETKSVIDPANGNVLSVARVAGAGGSDETTHNTYTAQGLVATTIDPLGNETDNTYDAQGRLITV